MQALIVSFVVFLCFSIVLSQNNTCSSFQSSCDACSRAGCRYVWNRPGFYNSSVNASCISTSEFQTRAAANQYANSKTIWAWALYDSEIKTKMGQRLLKIQTASSYAYNALPIPCYDVHRSFCRQPFGVLVGRTCDGYDKSALPGVTVTCTSIRNGQLISSTSNSAGFFNFLRLRAGAYRCSAAFPPSFTPVTVNVTIADKTNTTSEMCLTPVPSAITGRVYDSITGETLTNSVVDCTITDSFRTLRQTNSTFTASGTYLFEGVTVFGPVECVASNTPRGYSLGRNTGVSVRGKTVTVDIPLTPIPGRLFGYTYMQGSRTAVPGVNVTCRGNGRVFTQITNSTGAYDFGPVANGTYACTAELPGYQIINFNQFPTVLWSKEVQVDYELVELAATIFGYVYDSVTGAFLSGASVQCTVLTYNNFTTTNTDGYYVFSPVNAYGMASCNASALGYAASVKYFNTTTRGLRTQIDIPLVPLPGRLFGFAYLNGTTTPIPGVNVTCTSSVLRVTLTQLTGANGGYDFPNIKNGSYVCTATLRDYYSNPAVTVLVPQATSVRQDFFLSPFPASLFGYVYDSVTNALIPGARVQCSIQTYTDYNTTGADGYYYFYPIYVYDVASCNASAPGYLSSIKYFNTTARGVVTEIDIPLVPIPSGLYGYAFVNGTTTPISGVNVTCTSSVLRVTLTQLTGADGGYNFTNIRNGSYVCTATLQDYDSPAAVTVLVPQATTVRQDFFLRLAIGDLVVQVVEAFTNRRVFLNGAVVNLVQNGVTVGMNSTEAPESYVTFRKVRPGLYNLSTTYTDYSPFLRTNILVNTSGACVNSTFCPGGVVLLEVLALNSSIGGRVRNGQSSLGISGCQMELIITRASGTTTARGTTDSQGRYFIVVGTNNLGGGFGDVKSWELVASCSGFDQQSREINIPGPNKYIPNINFDLNVTTTGNVLVRVVDSISDAIPIAGANLTIFDSSQPRIFLVSNSTGYAFFTRVNAGSRTLVASSERYESQTVTLTVGAGDSGTNVNRVALRLKRGIINFRVLDSESRQRPGSYPIQCKENSLQLSIQPITDPEFIFKDVELPIGVRNLTFETPLYNSINLVLDIAEGRNPDKEVLLTKLFRKK